MGAPSELSPWFGVHGWADGHGCRHWTSSWLLQIVDDHRRTYPFSYRPPTGSNNLKCSGKSSVAFLLHVTVSANWVFLRNTLPRSCATCLISCVMRLVSRAIYFVFRESCYVSQNSLSFSKIENVKAKCDTVNWSGNCFDSSFQLKENLLYLALNSVWRSLGSILYGRCQSNSRMNLPRDLELDSNEPTMVSEKGLDLRLWGVLSLSCLIYLICDVFARNQSRPTGHQQSLSVETHAIRCCFSSFYRSGKEEISHHSYMTW